MPVGFIVDVEFVWGFQSRIVGLSKSPPSFYYPPPTTFLGAMAEIAAKENEIGEYLGKFLINEFSKNLLAIGWRPLNCTPIKYEDINKIIAIKITGEVLYPSLRDLKKSFDAPARGKTILSSLDDNSPTIRWILVFKNSEINVENDLLAQKVDKIELKEDLFWKIQRLGSKESRVSVVNVKKIVEIKRVRDFVETKYSFPVSAIGRISEEICGRWYYEAYVDPYYGAIYKIFGERHRESEGILERYFIERKYRVFKIPLLFLPTAYPTYALQLNESWIGYSIGDEIVIGRR